MNDRVLPCGGCAAGPGEDHTEECQRARAAAAKQARDRRYAEERYAWPGGYELFTVQDDGGVLCAPCVLDNWVEVSSSDGRDGWGIIGWSHTGEDDGPVICDHCGRVILEELEEVAP
jgi:hypothetical protein